MRIGKLAATMLALSMSMAACGGGGSGEASGCSAAALSGSGGGSLLAGPAADQNARGDLAAVATTAPMEGAVLSGRVRLEVEGSGIRNAELLPAAGGRPYALFTVAPDQSRAWVDFDTRTVGNSTVQMVIEAYDQLPGATEASMVTAMPVRTWTIQNADISSPYPGAYPLSRDPAPLQRLTALSAEALASEINAEWPRIHAMLQEYIPNNVIFDPPVPRGFEGPRSSCIRDAYGSPEACREYMLGILAMMQ